MEGIREKPRDEWKWEVSQGPAALDEADADDGSPAAAHKLKGGDHLDRSKSQGGGAPEEPCSHPQLDGWREGARKAGRYEQGDEETDGTVAANLVGKDPGKEDSYAGASKEDEGGNLGHDLVAAHQVPVLDDRVLELAGVIVPLLAGNQLDVVSMALDINLVPSPVSILIF